MSPPLKISSDTDERSRVDPRIPLWLFSGSAGKGKSELIGRIADAASAAGEPCALLFTDRDCWMRAWSGGTRVREDIARSASGTICSYAGRDIVNAIYQLHLRKLGLLSPTLAYDTLLVALGDELETGSFVALVQNNDRLDVTYRIARVVAAVDPAHAAWAMEETRSRRIGEADTLVLVPSARCGEGDVAAAESNLAAVNPLAAIYSADDRSLLARPAWRVPLGKFDEAGGRQLANTTGMVRLDRLGGPPVCVVGNLYNEAGTNAAADAHTIRTMRMSISGELDLTTYMQVVDGLTRSLGKGLLRLSALLNVHHAEFPISFEIIGGTMVQPAYGAARRRDASDICIAARELDARKTLRAFGQCAWKVAATDARFEAAI